MFDLDLHDVITTEYFPVYATEVGHAKADEQQQQNSPDDSAADPTTIRLRKNTMNEDELKAPHAIDSPV